MLSAPVHPIQSDYPANARVRDFGDGRRGIEIDGNGAPEPTGFCQRVSLTQGESRAIRSSVFVKSTLVAESNGYEGFGFDIKCLIRNDDSLVPLVTWTNAPFLGNDPESLYTDQYAEWTLITAVVYIPYDVPVEFVDCTWAVRGASGQVKFTSASLRNLYQDKFTTTIGEGGWSSFDRQLIPHPNTGGQYAELRYLDAYPVRVQKNEQISFHFDSFIEETAVVTSSGGLIHASFMVGLKMRRADGGYDFWHTMLTRVTSDDHVLHDAPIRISSEFLAESAYTQFEVIVSVFIDSGRTDYQYMVLKHKGINITVMAKDVVSSGGVVL